MILLYMCMHIGNSDLQKKLNTSLAGIWHSARAMLCDVISFYPELFYVSGRNCLISVI